jgi:hypothetical protein
MAQYTNQDDRLTPEQKQENARRRSAHFERLMRDRAGQRRVASAAGYGPGTGKGGTPLRKPVTQAPKTGYSPGTGKGGTPVGKPTKAKPSSGYSSHKGRIGPGNKSKVMKPVKF